MGELNLDRFRGFEYDDSTTKQLSTSRPFGLNEQTTQSYTSMPRFQPASQWSGPRPADPDYPGVMLHWFHRRRQWRSPLDSVS